MIDPQTARDIDAYILRDPLEYDNSDDIRAEWADTVGILIQRLDYLSRLPLNAPDDFWCYTIIGKANAAVGELDDIIPGNNQKAWPLEYKDAFRCAIIILYYAHRMAEDMPSSEHLATDTARDLVVEIVDYIMEVLPHLSKRRAV
jgi:hypothetical protein